MYVERKRNGLPMKTRLKYYTNDCKNAEVSRTSHSFTRYTVEISGKMFKNRNRRLLSRYSTIGQLDFSRLKEKKFVWEL